MQIEVGIILEGKVTGITKFGAFIALPEGKTGMVHISEVSTSYVNEIRDFLKEEQVVKAKVITIDEKGKIGLSIKKVQEEMQRKVVNAPTEFSAFTKNKSNIGPTNSFEDMMSKFKQDSDEKISDLKKVVDSKRSSSGFSRKNTNKY